jgi:8-oxo-dGTP pyrophosphatase MutT (NUDIX family)
MERKELRISNIKVIFSEIQAIEYFDAVVVVLFSSGEFMMVRNRARGWEFPGGRRQGNETYKETASREILEEAGAKADDVKLLGYYIDSENRVTVIACAEASSLGSLPESGEIAETGLFKKLPLNLSFGDGREQLFLKRARENRQMQPASRKDAT